MGDNKTQTPPNGGSGKGQANESNNNSPNGRFINDSKVERAERPAGWPDPPPRKHN